DYHVVDYVNGMHRSYPAADLLVTPSGAPTRSEASVAGAPALYLPRPSGNGQQCPNGSGRVRGGAPRPVDNADFSRATVEETILPLMNDRARLEQMSRAALSLNYPTDAAERMAAIVTRALEG